jgi:glutamyl-tRNA synthetase
MVHRVVGGVEEDVIELIKGYALKNAVKYNGKASLSSVMSMLLTDRPDLRPKAREIVAIAKNVIEEVNKMSLDDQQKLLEEKYSWVLKEKRPEKEERKTLPPLPGAEEGKVVTRFAPNPDFVIHIGNARPAILSFEYAKMYKGKFILRFEDTDPRTKSPIKEVYDLIRKDLKWLGISWDEEYIQSLRMEVYYQYARLMLERGCAYVDLCKERSRDLLKMGKACETRDRPAEWQLEQFDKMLEGYYSEGEAVVRIKTDLNHPNPSIRDWVALRIIDTEKYPHPLTGSKYIVWPTYNFAVSIDDHLLGITHVLRGKEHEVNTEKQIYVYKCLGWKPPVFIHFGRLKLEGFIMSKSYIRKLIEENPGKFWGYDDPRFGTIAGLRRRGILPEAIKQSILDIGVKPGDVTLSWANLAAINRKILDPKADRLMFVEDPVELSIKNLDRCIKASIPFHPDRPERRREIEVCPDDRILISKDDHKVKRKVRLVGLGNFIIKDNSLEFLGTSLEDARKEGMSIIQWVLLKDAVPLEVLEPKGLDLIVHKGYAEKAVKLYREDARLQLLRFGFVRIDRISGNKYIAIYTHD